MIAMRLATSPQSSWVRGGRHGVGAYWNDWNACGWAPHTVVVWIRTEAYRGVVAAALLLAPSRRCPRLPGSTATDISNRFLVVASASSTAGPWLVSFSKNSECSKLYTLEVCNVSSLSSGSVAPSEPSSARTCQTWRDALKLLNFFQRLNFFQQDLRIWLVSKMSFSKTVHSSQFHGGIKSLKTRRHAAPDIVGAHHPEFEVREVEDLDCRRRFHPCRFSQQPALRV